MILIPDHNYHMNVDLICIGEQFEYTHQIMDSFQPLLQSNHREFFHDYSTVVKIYELTTDIRAAWSAFFHVCLDRISDDVGKSRCIAEFLLRYKTGEIINFNENMFPPLDLNYFEQMEIDCYD